MKELITTFLLSFFIAETAQALVSGFAHENQVISKLKILESDLE